MTLIRNTSNKLIIREGPRLSGMVDTNHLIRYAQVDPVFVDSAIRMAFTSMGYVGDPMMELSLGNGTPFILSSESDSWKWRQVIRPRPAVILENLESSNTTPGIDGTSFKIKLDQDWFSKGEILTSDKLHFVRIATDQEPYQESGGWVYFVNYVTDDPTAFYPTELLAPGSEYLSSHNLYGEQSSLQSGVHFDNIITLQDTLGDMMRFEHKVTGYVDDMVLNFEMWEADPQTGKPVKMVDSKWINRAEIKFWKHIDKAKSNYLFYGQGASFKGEKGFAVNSRYGVKYQLEHWGNVETYSQFSEKLLREYLMDIYIGRLVESERNVVLLTGEVGFMFFDEAMKREANKFLLTNDVVMRGSDPMNQEFGYQFRQYHLINGGIVKLMKLPHLDGDITNTMRDPNTGYPRQSANFYVMDFSGQLKDNFRVVKRANSLKYGYLHGTSAPWTMNGQVMSVTEDAYTLVARDRCSPWIQDVSATGALLWKPQ